MRTDGPSLTARLTILAVVFGLMVAAAARWALDADRPAEGAFLIMIGLALIGSAAAAHLMAVRHPERHALEGLAWVLTVVVVIGVGMGSLAVALAPVEGEVVLGG